MAKNKDKVRRFDKFVIGIKNTLTKLRGKKFLPQNILLLFSHCLQKSKCKNKITDELDNCKRCGACVVGSLLDLRDSTGIQCAIATGGRLAKERAMSDDVKAIVAIACEQELSEGIMGMFSKTVIAIPNQRPCGPCKDCHVEMDCVVKAVNKLTK